MEHPLHSLPEQRLKIRKWITDLKTLLVQTLIDPSTRHLTVTSSKGSATTTDWGSREVNYAATYDERGLSLACSACNTLEGAGLAPSAGLLRERVNSCSMGSKQLTDATMSRWLSERMWSTSCTPNPDGCATMKSADPKSGPSSKDVVVFLLLLPVLETMKQTIEGILPRSASGQTWR
jgi:hypothetical protein